MRMLCGKNQNNKNMFYDISRDIFLLGAIFLLLTSSLLGSVAQAQEPSSSAPAVTAPAAAAAPTDPMVVGFDKISAGDTAWMLTSTALVLMMTIPGLALFYAGMVRKKNVLAT